MPHDRSLWSSAIAASSPHKARSPMFRRKRTLVLAGMKIFSTVSGLRPVRSSPKAFASTPSPGISKKWLAFVSAMTGRPALARGQRRRPAAGWIWLQGEQATLTCRGDAHAGRSPVGTCGFETVSCCCALRGLYERVCGFLSSDALEFGQFLVRFFTQVHNALLVEGGWEGIVQAPICNAGCAKRPGPMARDVSQPGKGSTTIKSSS